MSWSRKRAYNGRSKGLGAPDRWMHCPRKSALVADLFVAFKAPLDNTYNNQVPQECRFYPEMAFKASTSCNKQIGLWIDLANTNRFYNKSVVENAGIEYKKLNCKGFGECPGEEQVEQFVNVCKLFSNKHPDQLIGVHCTHGFNRTGFMIVSYLVIEKNFSLDAALTAFSKARPPGIYKQDYITELCQRFERENEIIQAPPRPVWFKEAANGDEESSAPKQQKQQMNFLQGVSGVEAVQDELKIKYVRKCCRELCNYAKQDFPGAQPVSLDIDNVNLFRKSAYMVSWKADGTRYLMLIDGQRSTYLIGRDNVVFVAPTLTFFRKNSNEPLVKTLVDGELVFDKVEGGTTPRYLIYDILSLNGQRLTDHQFHQRQAIVRDEVIHPRTVALRCGQIRRHEEPFGIRDKPFYQLDCVEKVLSLKVDHETDGLIFQPVNEPYVGGRSSTVLKWKPPHLNSVDFRLEIVKDNRAGMLAEYVGNLMVLNCETPFDRVKVTKDLKKHDGKIVEFSVVNNQWTFLRERVDKLVPNSFETAKGVRHSIRAPVTEEFLINFIRNEGFKYKLVGDSLQPVSESSTA